MVLLLGIVRVCKIEQNLESPCTDFWWTRDSDRHSPTVQNMQ